MNNKGMRFPVDVILVFIRWYAAYHLSYRLLKEMMHERGVLVDHSSINRWAIRFLPLLDKAFRRHKRAVGPSWRMDETYIRINGAWKYLYRAVDQRGQRVNFLLAAKGDAAAAKRFLEKATSTTLCPTRLRRRRAAKTRPHWSS